jgi:hypothetical protein
MSGLNDGWDDEPTWSNGHDPAPPTQEPPKYRFPLVRFADITLGDTPRCIVEDLIPRESLVVVWGPPKCGKSFFVFDLVMHIALGRTYRGKRVEQGTVVYIAAFRQKRITNGDGDPPFYLLTTRLDLVADLDELIADIKAQIPSGEAPPTTIVVDTLNRTLRGSENKDEDMAAYRDAADLPSGHWKCSERRSPQAARSPRPTLTFPATRIASAKICGASTAIAAASRRVTRIPSKRLSAGRSTCCSPKS